MKAYRQLMKIYEVDAYRAWCHIGQCGMPQTGKK